AAMRDQLITPCTVSFDKLGAVLVVRRVRDHRRGQAQLFKQFDQPEPTNAVSILTPEPAALTPWQRLSVEVDTARNAVRKVLEVDGDIHRQTLALRPVELRPGRKCRIFEAIMRGEHANSCYFQ